MTSTPTIIRASASNPIELSRYAYAVNNPIMFSDPSEYAAMTEKTGRLTALLMFVRDTTVTCVQSTICRSAVRQIAIEILEQLLELGLLQALQQALETDYADTKDRVDDKSKPSCDPNCVIRGGVAAVGSFIQGYALRELPPLIYGFSVQYRPGVLLKELAQVGLLNKQLSYARDTEIMAIGAALGYVVSIPITSGFGLYHATVTVNDTNGYNVPAPLPAELDAAFAAVFWRKMPNPSRPS